MSLRESVVEFGIGARARLDDRNPGIRIASPFRFLAKMQQRPSETETCWAAIALVAGMVFCCGLSTYYFFMASTQSSWIPFAIAAAPLIAAVTLCISVYDVLVLARRS